MPKLATLCMHKGLRSPLTHNAFRAVDDGQKVVCRYYHQQIHTFGANTMFMYIALMYLIGREKYSARTVSTNNAYPPNSKFDYLGTK